MVPGSSPGRLTETGSPPLTTLAAVLILIAFFALERVLRRGAEARSLVAGPFDRGTTRGIGAAFGLSILAVVLSPVLNALGIGALPEAIGWIGIALMLWGLALRVWAARVLGAAYTRTLRIAERQLLVRAGPYRVIRHPGYTGDLMMWLGAGLATRNVVAVIAIVLLMASAYAARIEAEEAMLVDVFGDEYRAYSRHTWRLLPPLY